MSTCVCACTHSLVLCQCWHVFHTIRVEVRGQTLVSFVLFETGCFSPFHIHWARLEIFRGYPISAVCLPVGVMGL